MRRTDFLALLAQARHRFRNSLRVWEAQPQRILPVTAGTLLIIDTFVHPISLVGLGLAVVALSPFIFKFIETLEFPSGFKFKFRDQLEEVTERAQEAGLLQEPNKPAAFESVYAEDPTLALAGLRIEIERRIDALWQLTSPNVRAERNAHPALYAKVRALSLAGILSDAESAIVHDLIPLLNRAVHSQAYSRTAADWAIRAGPQLLAGLDKKIESVKSAAKGISDTTLGTSADASTAGLAGNNGRAGP